MSEQPLISVIVPVYKVEPYLDRCVQSIVNQTYKNLEIILVDDGSPDHCPAMCDAWAEKDSRIRVIHKENGGVSTARNAGINIAKGAFFTFVDSDDWIDRDALQLLWDKAVRQHCIAYKRNQQLMLPAVVLKSFVTTTFLAKLVRMEMLECIPS